jgi:hypothetical protein
VHGRRTRRQAAAEFKTLTGIELEPIPPPGEKVAPTVRDTSKAFRQGVTEALVGYRINVGAFLDEPECREALLRTICDLVELERLDAVRLDRELRAKTMIEAAKAGPPISPVPFLPPALTEEVCELRLRLQALEQLVAVLAPKRVARKPAARKQARR